MPSISKFQSYIDKHTRKRHRLKQYIVFVVFLAVLLGIVKTSHFDEHIDTLLENISSTPLPSISDLTSWYRSAAFVDKNLYTDYSGIFPDLDDFAQHEMTWLARTWSFWAGGVGLGLPLVIFILFQVYKRIKIQKHFPPSLDENGLVIYREIHRQVHRAYWRANNHNFEKSFFLISLLGIFLFGVQFLLQPFVMLSHNLLISVIVSFMFYATLVYFFYLFWHRFDQSRVIRIIDQEMDLRQSLSTALGVGEDYHSSSLYLYLLKETKERLCRDNILRFFPRKFPRINYRNIGITTFFMGMTIFLVSVALPVMALVYDNLRSGLFVSPDKKEIPEKVENVILEESGKILVLKDFLITRKELPEFEPVVNELSDLSRKLNKIVMDDEKINDIQTLNTGAKGKTKKKWLTEGDQGKKEEENFQEKVHTIQNKEIIAGHDLDQHLALQLNVLIKDLIRYDLEKKDGKYPASSVVNKEETPSSSADYIPVPNISYKTLPHTRKPYSSILSTKGKRVVSSVKKDVKKLRKLTDMLTDIQYQLDRLQLGGSSEHDGLSWNEKPEKLSVQDRLNLLSQKLIDNDEVSPSDDRENQSSLDRENRLIHQSSDKQEQGQTVLDTNMPEQVAIIEDTPPWSESSPDEDPYAGDRQEDPSAHLQAQRKKDDPKEAIESEQNIREMESESMNDQYPDEKAKKDIVKKMPVKTSRLNRKNNLVNLLKLNQNKPVILPESKDSELSQSEPSSSAYYPNLKLPVGGYREAFQDRNPKNNLVEAKLNHPYIKLQKISGKKHPDKNTDGEKSNNIVKNQPGKPSGLKRKSGGDLLLQRSSDLTPVKNQDWERVQKEERNLGLSSQSTEKNSTGSLYGSDEDADDEVYTQKIYQPTSIKFFREELVSKVNDCIHLGNTISFREGIQKNILQLKQFRNKIVSVINPMDIDGIPQNALDPMKRIEDARMIKNKPVFSMGRSVVSPKDINELSSDIRLISDSLKGTVTELESGVYDSKIAYEVQNSPKNSAFRQSGNSNSTSQAYKGKFPGRVNENSTINPNKLPFAYSGDKSPKASSGTINVGGAKTRPKMSGNLIGEIVDDLKHLYTQVRDMGKFTPPTGSRIFNNQLFLASGDELDRIVHLQNRIRQEDDLSNIKNLANDVARLTRQMGNKGLVKGLEKPQTATFENPAHTSLVRDIDRIKEQIRIEQNPSRLQDLSAELAQRIMELHARSLEQNAPKQNSNKQKQTTSLSKRISEQASRMNSDELNLKNLSAEFIQQVESYSQSAQSDGIPPENPQGSANKHSQFTQLKKDLQKQTSQMRRESSPRNLRNSANRIAQNIREFEIRNRLYVDRFDYEQESLEEMGNYRLTESKGNSSHLSPEVTKTEKSPRDRQNPQNKENPVLIGRDQLAYLAQNIQELAGNMQNYEHQKDMENLKNDILEKTGEYMLLTFGRGTREEHVDKMRSGSEDQLIVPVGRLQQGQSAEPTITGKKMHPESREPNSVKGTPDDYPMQAGENINNLRWQMERLTEQLQVDKHQVKQKRQDIVKTANQFQNQISGSIPTGQTGLSGTTNLQILKGLEKIQEITRLIQSKDNEQDLKNLVNLLSQVTKKFSSQMLGQRSDLDIQLDSSTKMYLKAMISSVNRIIDQIRQETQINKIHDLSSQIDILAQQMRENILPEENMHPEIQHTASYFRQTPNRSSEVLPEQKKAGQNLKSKNDMMPFDSRQSHREGQRLAKLNSRLDLLSSDLRQETNPNRIRKLSKDSSRLVSQIQDLDNSPKQQLSRIGKNLSGLANDLSTLNSEKKRSEVSRDIKLQARELRKLSQQITNPEHQKELALAADRALQISKIPKQNLQSMHTELADLSRKILNQISFLKNRPSSVNLKARDNLFSKFSNLSERIRSERNHEELAKLKDQLADNLSRMQDRFLKKTRPEKIDRVAGKTQENQGNTRQVPSIKGADNAELDRIISEMNLLQTQSESDAKNLQKLGREMADLSRDLLDQKKITLPMQKSRKQFYNMQATTRLIPNMQDDSLKTGGRQKKRQYSLSEGKDRSDKNSYSEERFISQTRTIDRTRKSLTDISSRIQKISDKIQKENNPQKIKKYQKQLVVLNQRMIDTLQKNISDAQEQLPGSSLTTERREQLYEQMKTLAEKLSKAGKGKQLDRISNHLDRLASNILSMKKTISTDRIRKRAPRDSNKNRVNDKKGMEKIEEKSTAAIKMINKTIKKLNTYRKKNKNKKTTTSNEDGKGVEGINNKQLMMADRFEADKITKDTDVIPNTGVVRNVLSMEKNLHRDDVLERIIRRLEMNKKQIEKAARVTEEKDILDYSSDIAISREAAKQPPGLVDIRYSPKAKVTIGISKKNIEKEFEDKTVSAMSYDPRFLSVRFKMENFKDQDMIPMQEIQSKKDKDVRLSPFQQTVDSVDEDTIPHIYQNILRRLFSDKEKSVKETRR